MAETFYDSIRREIGRELGLDRDPSNWSANSISDVNDVIQGGLRRALYPPVIPGERKAHQWYFLNPIATMQLKSGVEDYLMPHDFSGLIGDFTFHGANNVFVSSISFVSEPEIRRLRATDTQTVVTCYPRYVALRFDRQHGVTQQTQWAMFWPTPDDAYTVQYQYFTAPPKLDANNPTPPGGPDQEELFRAAILAEVELLLEDFQGPRYANFMERLAAAVSRDRTTSVPDLLGYNGDGQSMEAGHRVNTVSYIKDLP